MKPFKVDTKGYTEEQRAEMQRRWFEMGYEWKMYEHCKPYFLNERFFYAEEDGRLSVGITKQVFLKKDYEERRPNEFLISPEIDLSEYETIDIDYTGCDPVIAAALKRDKWISCQLGSESLEATIKSYVIAYERSANYPYVASDGGCYQLAKPTKPVKKIKPYTISIGLKIESSGVERIFTYNVTKETMEKIKEIVNDEQA